MGYLLCLDIWYIDSAVEQGRSRKFLVTSHSRVIYDHLFAGSSVNKEEPIKNDEVFMYTKNLVDVVGVISTNDVLKTIFEIA